VANCGRGTGQQAFDRECAALGIEHRLSPPRHPQTHGRAERFNGRITDLMRQTRFASAGERSTALERDLILYNHHIPKRALNHLTPIQALQKWYREKPELFVKPIHGP